MQNCVTKKELKQLWKSINTEKEVVLFYGHNEKNDYKEFSNFWPHEPFDFIIPEWCGMFAGNSYSVEFSEKAIMLCKASLFLDSDYFYKILKADTPQNCKALGRKCKFEHENWQNNVCNIAKSVVYQKFLKVKNLKEILLNTNDCLIAEASPRDIIWGIGFGKNNPKSKVPSQWRGTNILGWALMEARKDLK